MNKFLDYKFYTIFLIAILLLIAVAIIIDQCKFYPVLITENSILYIFSVIPQVIIGLLALTLVALPYQFNILENKTIQDEQWFDAVVTSKNFIFNNFIAVFLIGISTVISSLISLGSFEYQRIQNYFFTLSTLGALVFLSYFIYLIIYSFNPDRLKNIENKYIVKLNEEIRQSIKPKTQTIEPKGFDISNISVDSNIDNKDSYQSIGSFISKFAQLENKIRHLHKEKFPNSKNTPLFTAIRQLCISEALTIQQGEKINRIRMFRNALVHRDSQQVVKPELLNQYNQMLEKVIAELKP